MPDREALNRKYVMAAKAQPTKAIDKKNVLL
jgi:hypothetical protein